MNKYNIPVNDHQQLELKLINEAHRFEYFCKKIHDIIKCNYDEKESEIENSICQYIYELDLKNITDKEKSLIFNKIG